jgi:hypothetical protein
MKLIVGSALLLLAAAAITHLAWKGGGTNEWQLARDENGIQVFTLKAPGQTLLKVRATMTLDASLSSAVALLRDDPLGGGDVAGSESRVIEQIETPSVYLSYLSMERQLSAPFGARELVALVNYSQDPVSRRVEINVQAAPTKAPPTGAAPRVKHLNNVIRLSPSAGGKLEWEISSDVDMDVPYPLANIALPRQLFDQLNAQRDRVLTQKYARAKLVSVREL